MMNHQFVDGMRAIACKTIQYNNSIGRLFISDKQELGKYRFETEDDYVFYCNEIESFELIHYKEIEELRDLQSKLDAMSWDLLENKEVDSEVVERLDEAIRNIRKAIISLKTK